MTTNQQPEAPPQQPQREHCDHECVCTVLAFGGIEGDRSPCDFSGCKHDTRQHIPAPEATPDYVFEIETCTLGVYLSQFPLSSDVHQKICMMVNELVIEAKAEAARTATLAENKRVLDLIEVFANTSSQIVDINGECGDESSDVVEADELKSLIESLRTAAKQEQPK
jgi:hypothetical protein